MRVKYRPGDVVAIPLGGASFAFGRLLKDASIEVFSYIGGRKTDLADIRKMKTAFVAGVFDTAVRSGTWPVLGHLPFASPEEAWPPPKFVEDILKPGTYRIYHRGEMRPASPQEVQGLDRAEMYKPEQLVQRIRDEVIPSRDGS